MTVLCLLGASGAMGACTIAEKVDDSSDPAVVERSEAELRRDKNLGHLSGIVKGRGGGGGDGGGGGGGKQRRARHMRLLANR